MNIARLRRIRLLFYVFVWWAPAPAIAAELCATPVGQIVSIQGTVEIQEGAHGIRRQARLNEPLCDGTVIFVGDRSRAEASLVDQSTYRLDQNTTLRLVQVRPGARSLMELLRGVTYFFARQPRSLAIDTPFINAAVEGTEFVLSADAGQTLLTVFEGAVLASNDRGELLVASGSSAVARAGEAPEPYLTVRPRDAVQWAIYYPFVLLPLADASGAAAGALPEPLGGAVALAGRGEYAAAFARFDAIPEADRTSEFYLYRAGALLAVGRIDEARTDIAAALALDPGNGPALALRAVIAVAQNDDAAALEDARRAVEISPTSAAAKIALSYALQSQFQLEAARDALQQAVTDEPENALAYARLSELWLMLGYRDRALRAARTAQALAPDLERTQSVLGFAALAEFDTKRARTSFERAIEIDSANPQPRLGLGLAVIRDGSLKQGRREIERAVALDPDNALLRSYLGKAFFEEKKDNLASDQFAMAKALDPKDPTPWFYDAIQLETQNRPVEALRSLEKSIELNDNRAVYRSRELLDEDRAARGASLGRIYNDVGFEQVGINQATQSLTIDPANASAHRFLSDVYATQPRRDIARASELLQSQLLQDININPVQPSLVASDFNIITQGGPAQAGFNEYNSLFERDRAQLSLSGVAGSDWTRGEEAVVSGVYDRYSLSAGQFHYQSDGFRQNFNANHDVYNAFAQVAITPELNVQAEVQRRYSEQGDLQLNFNGNQYFKARDVDIEENTARLGLRYSPSPKHDILGSFISTKTHLNDQGSEAVFQGIPLPLHNNTDISSVHGEGQYICHTDNVNITVGSSYYNADSHLSIMPVGSDDFVIFDEFDPSKEYTGYLYSNIHWPQDMKWTVGLAYETYDEAQTHIDNANPKLGLQWNVLPDLTLRAAAFQVVRPPLGASQTLQPTQVAGFNQFFDDINGTQATTYGFGLDARPAKSLYAGAEILSRELDIPISANGQSIDRNDYIGRLYAYWAPLADWALTGDIIYDSSHFDETDEQSVFPKQLDTFSVPIAIRYFSPTGFFASGGLTFVNQSVTWNEGQTTYNKGDNNLFLLDTGIGYRLPRRLGIVSFQARNLLNQRFNYKNDAFRETGRAAPNISTPFLPERSFIAQVYFTF